MELHDDKKKERQPGVAATAKYKRILLKLSGEALMGDDSFGINRATIERIVGEIAQVAALGLEIAVVIGGGEIFCGGGPGAGGRGSRPARCNWDAPAHLETAPAAGAHGAGGGEHARG